MKQENKSMTARMPKNWPGFNFEEVAKYYGYNFKFTPHLIANAADLVLKKEEIGKRNAKFVE